MQALTQFYSRLLPHVPGCSEPMAAQALLDSAIEFSERTAVVRFITDPVPLVAATANYDVYVPTDYRVSVVRRAWCGTRELIAVAAEFVPAPGDSTQGAPRWFYSGDPGTVTVYPTPSATDTDSLVFDVAVKPSISAARLDDILYHDWIDAVVAGACKRLCEIPDQPFTSAGKADLAGRRFLQYVNRATSFSTTGRIRSSLSVAGRSFV